MYPTMEKSISTYMLSPDRIVNELIEEACSHGMTAKSLFKLDNDVSTNVNRSGGLVVSLPLVPR